MNPKTILSIGGVIAVTIGLTMGMISAGSAQSAEEPFTPVAALSSLSALKSEPIFAAPVELRRLPTDVYDDHRTWELGRSAYVWQDGQQICTLMKNRGPGGCFSSFSKPVILYLWGSRHGFYAGGIVPDIVEALTLITSTGRVEVGIEMNAFIVPLPAYTSILGEEVTLRNGRVFSVEDRLRLPLP